MNRPLLAAACAALTCTALVPATASAATRTCASLYPKDELPIRISGGNCALAQGLDQYVASHESTDGAFAFDHHSWLGDVYSRAHGHTYFKYVTHGRGPVNVWITSRYAVD